MRTKTILIKEIKNKMAAGRDDDEEQETKRGIGQMESLNHNS